VYPLGNDLSQEVVQHVVVTRADKSHDPVRWPILADGCRNLPGVAGVAPVPMAGLSLLVQRMDRLVRA